MSAPSRESSRLRIRTGSSLSEFEWSLLLARQPILDGLAAPELERLRELAEQFLRVKRFEAAEGMVLVESMKAVIAVHACLPILNLGLRWYRNWKTVVVVPEHFVGKARSIDPAGVVHEWEDVRVGESWVRGPVVLSWADVQRSELADGFNVVIHEAAHRLDQLDGAMNGRPALHREMSAEEWKKEFTAAYFSLERQLSMRRFSAVSAYALASPSEFFAVVSELFFELPHSLLREFPRVYRLLQEFYRQQPDRRLRGQEGAGKVLT